MITKVSGEKPEIIFLILDREYENGKNCGAGNPV
jgi:hypothetical protein